MEKHKPVFFIIYLLTFLFIVIFIIKINGKFVFSTQIKFVSIDNFLNKKKDTTSNQQNTILTKRIEAKSDSIILPIYESKSETELNIYIDSLIKISKLDLNESNIKESPFLYNYQINGKYPLDSFFEKISNADSSSKLFRIAHYGDSQIEGDRMTFELRKLFRSKFLCEGVGYVPMQDITDPVSYVRKSNGSWTRYTVFTNKIKGYSYGQGGSVYRYAPSLKSSISLNILSSYKKAYLYYGFGSDSCFLDVYSSKRNLLASHKINQKSKFNAIDLNLSSNETNLDFVFRGPSPAVYGVSFDGQKGMQFDNYGLRGQAGDGLMLIPKSDLIDMYNKTNTSMAIVQFGGNVVQGIKSEKSLNFYGNIYKNLYLHFKSALSNGSVLIIGINDVSRSVNGVYESYPNIGEMRNIQRKSAVENGMAFFDIYQLMGGENSVKIWNEKGLASRDGHYSDKGRDIVCKEIYKALMYEYKKYLTRKNKVHE